MKASKTADFKTCIGLFFTTLAILMYEILLTRIFSVSMYYHFAFLAVSVAMFGMTAGAVTVYLCPEFFSRERTGSHLSFFSLLFSGSVAVCFLTHLSVGFPLGLDWTVTSVFAVALNYIVVGLPFFFSGICVCLALTRFPGRVSLLYAVDLAGAAMGCLAVLVALSASDGPTAVLFAAVAAGTGAVAFSWSAASARIMKWALFWCAALLYVAGTNCYFLATGESTMLPMLWVKGKLERKPLYEKWNSFSRIQVSGDQEALSRPDGVGLSPVLPPYMLVKQLDLEIDALASTRLTHFRGDPRELDFLKYDVINTVHNLRTQADVLVVGVGGGRDVLSALAFGQKSVTGVEINKEILDTINSRYGGYCGHLDRHPAIRFVHDEARSYLSASRDMYDIIQVSFIDSWAATAAGAFVLTENSLYTIQAWKVFLDHLKPAGVLTFSRWHHPSDSTETCRLTALAVASLADQGVSRPRDHVIIVARMPSSRKTPFGVATILVSKEPFSQKDVAAVNEVAERLGFRVLLSPAGSADMTLADLTSGADVNEIARRFPLNIEPPTDDSPFFFNMLRMRDVFSIGFWSDPPGVGALGPNTAAVGVLGVLLMIVLVLTSAGIVGPLLLTGRLSDLRGAGTLFVFFAAIGLAYLLIEISVMQRLIIFLGHPTYALTVVLFVLLLSSGLGSSLTGYLNPAGRRLSAVVLMWVLVAVVAAGGLLAPRLVSAFAAAGAWQRIAVAAGLLFPMGLVMGVAFPLGMILAQDKAESITPWLWGVNGSTSVVASVLAVVIALGWSVSTAFWAGAACYAVAAVCMTRLILDNR